MKTAFEIHGETDLGLKIGDSIEIKGTKYSMVKSDWKCDGKNSETKLQFVDENEWLKHVTLITIARHEEVMREQRDAYEAKIQDRDRIIKSLRNMVFGEL